MRSSILISGFIASVAAQKINWSQVVAAPAVVITAAPIVGSSQTVSAQSSGAAASIGSAAVQASPIAQRDVQPIEKRDGTCAQQPAGTGPAVHNPDTPSAFEHYPYFIEAAYSAPVPAGYVPSFINLNASTSTSSYMGYTTLSKYDTNQCASLCTQQTGCQAFNLYFERDPTLDPNAQSCPNPPSLTNIKCVFWGVPISSATATNQGQYRDSFEVVIAGSNGYNVITLPPGITGFTGPIPWPGAPSCPSDPTGGYSTFIGSTYFSFGIGPGQIQTVSNEVCVAACAAQTAYNFAHPPTSGSPVVCNQVISYVVNNPYGYPEGMYCALYTESWDASYGTLKESAFNGGNYTFGSAFAYTNATYSSKYEPICQGSGCGKTYAGGNCGGWGAGTC